MRLHWTVIAIYLFASFWAMFAFLWFFRDSTYHILYTIVGLFYAIVLSVSAYFLGKKHLWAWWVAIILVGFSILISLLDEIGIVDIVFLLGASGLFALLFTERKRLIK